jgi:Uma2 family endonuclease
MTVTNPLVRDDGGAPWTLGDLETFPDDGNRYEIFDGSLLVTPHADVTHGAASNRLHRILTLQAPDHLFVGHDIGVSRKRSSYFVPDLFVVKAEAFAKRAAALHPSDVVLVVEVLSTSNPGNDLVLKRHEYAAAGIPTYWIVDPIEQAMRVLELDEGAYREAETVRPGAEWRTDRPFRLSVDLGEVF